MCRQNWRRFSLRRQICRDRPRGRPLRPLLAALLAKLMRGNVIASLLATFVGNPLTFLPIAAISMQTGNFLLGRVGVHDDEMHRSLGGKFVDD